MKKVGIELNGIANILLLLDQIKDKEGLSFSKIEQQLDFLERYMLAYNKAINNNESPPYWHDVIKSPHNYPTNRA